MASLNDAEGGGLAGAKRERKALRMGLMLKTVAGDTGLASSTASRSCMMKLGRASAEIRIFHLVGA